MKFQSLILTAKKKKKKYQIKQYEQQKLVWNVTEEYFWEVPKTNMNPIFLFFFKKNDLLHNFNTLGLWLIFYSFSPHCFSERWSLPYRAFLFIQMLIPNRFSLGKKKGKCTFPLFHKMSVFLQSICFPWALRHISYQCPANTYLQRSHYSFPVFSSILDSPNLCHQHSLRTHDLVTSHASSCNCSKNLSPGGINLSFLNGTAKCYQTFISLFWFKHKHCYWTKRVCLSVHIKAQ